MKLVTVTLFDGSDPVIDIESLFATMLSGSTLVPATTAVVANDRLLPYVQIIIKGFCPQRIVYTFPDGWLLEALPREEEMPR